MRALILITGAALAVAAATPAEAKDGKHREDRYESPYSLRAETRKREARELAREIAKAEREERRRERAYKHYTRDEPDEEGCDCEDDE